MQTGDDEYTESICRPRYHTYKRSVRSETYTWRRIRDVCKTAHVSSADEYRLVWVQYTRLHTVHCRAVTISLTLGRYSDSNAMHFYNILSNCPISHEMLINYMVIKKIYLENAVLTSIIFSSRGSQISMATGIEWYFDRMLSRVNYILFPPKYYNVRILIRQM